MPSHSCCAKDHTTSAVTKAQTEVFRLRAQSRNRCHARETSLASAVLPCRTLCSALAWALSFEQERCACCGGEFVSFCQLDTN